MPMWTRLSVFTNDSLILMRVYRFLVITIFCCIVVCREGGFKRSLCHCSVRIAQVQTDRRSGCPKVFTCILCKFMVMPKALLILPFQSVLWCTSFHHGKWCQGLWGDCVRKAERSEGKIDEVCWRVHDPLRQPHQGLHRQCRDTCTAQTRSVLCRIFRINV